MKWNSITFKITLLFLGALLLNGAVIIAINVYQTNTMYTNEYDQEIREIAAKFQTNQVLPNKTEDFNRLSSYHIYLKLAYEAEVDRTFMSLANVERLRETPHQTTIIRQNDANYIAAIFPFAQDELIIMKQIPLLNERSTPIFTYSIIAVVVLSLPLLVILFVVLRRFSKPIVRMNEISESFAEGDFSKQISVESNDEIGQLAMSLNQLAVRLKEKEVARDTFLAGVSHELRTPLTTLKANTSGIIEGVVPPDKVNHFLTSNIEEIERMIRMVNDLILVSTFEHKLSLHLERISLRGLIDSVLQSMKLYAQNKRVQFDVDDEQTFDVTVDQAKMKQVLINLLHNAIEHSPQDGTVFIEWKLTPEAVLLSIRDQGSGFREQQLAHLFERFTRDDTRSGLGLGLYISRHIIEAHQGQLAAGNHPAGGAIVEIRFMEK
jgi:signal transduction histidine kinase